MNSRGEKWILKDKKDVAVGREVVDADCGESFVCVITQ